MNFDSFNNSEYLLEQQLITVLNTCFDNYISGKDYYNFRCNICGDSKRHKFKKRGYLLKNKEKRIWYYYCHNCQSSMSAIKWLKEYYPIFYKNYIKSILNNNHVINPIIPKITTNKIIKNESEKFKCFIPILKGKDDLFKKAIDICNKRMIPENIWNKWYVATDGFYKNRLIIPFFDNNNKIYYWQGLRLDDSMTLKYLSRIGEKYNSIYNYYNIDSNKPVIILEGCIDSLFIDNAIALTGLKIYNDELNNFKHKYFLLDNDADGKKKSLKLLKNNEFVFIWPLFIKDYNLPNKIKDINDVIIYLKRKNIFTFSELFPYFSNSIFKKVYLLPS